MAGGSSVLVASRGPAWRLEALLASLAEGGEEMPGEVIVVDNGSPSYEVTACAERFGARPIRLNHNAGFSRAINLAAAEASGETLVLVNDDCVCEPGFAAELAAGVDPASGVGMAAAVLREAGDRGRIDSAGMQLDRTLLVYDYLNGEPLAAAASARDPIGPSAAAAAFDRELFCAHGGFDERIFAYWEDVDLVLRLRRAGIRCRLRPGAVATHAHSATLGSGSSEKNRLMGFGRGYVLRKWGVLGGRRVVPALAGELALVAGQAALDRNLAGAPARVRGWWAATPSEAYPGELLAGHPSDGLARSLARRLARRRRLARASRS